MRRVQECGVLFDEETELANRQANEDDIPTPPPEDSDMDKKPPANPDLDKKPQQESKGQL